MDRRKFVFQTVVGGGALAAAMRGDAADDGGPPPTNPTTPTSPTPPTSASSLPQFLTWDGGSGPSRDWWSQKLQMPWEHNGLGDWLDARQQSQGSMPYAQATVSGAAVALNVTALVSRWVSTGVNRGMYLRSAQVWPFTFAGRAHATVSARPRLVVVTNRGTRVLECTCNAAWSPSSYMAKDSRNMFNVAKDNQFAALCFDLSTVSGTVQSAMLTLTCLVLKYPGTLEVFELNPPEFRNGRGAQAARLGIANNFMNDANLGSHPSVLFASDFADLSKAHWQTGRVAATSTQVRDARTGTTYLRSLIPKGELLGCDLDHSVVAATATGVPAKVETALYGRYYVYLEEDWGSEVDANKMPGWDGRFGWWNPVGYWQSTTGNGGARPTGLKVRNTATNRWVYEGASMRGHGGTRAGDGNPYDDLFWIGSYIYHLDQADSFGEAIRWPSVVLGKGRWYCIEQFIQMNSIVGPFDAIGNGVAVNDGQYRVWVDGVQVYERTNFRWRRHPEMGIQGFWLNWYHGGTAAAPRNMHFRMNSVAIARAYIGPRNDGTGG